MVCLETTFIIDFLRGIEVAVKLMEKVIETSEPIAIAAPTLVEVATGAALAESHQEEKNLNELLTRLTTLPLDQKAALLAGKLQAELIKTGENIGHVDITIGAIALANGEKLLTKNIKHFSRIPGLIVEDYSKR